MRKSLTAGAAALALVAASAALADTEDTPGNWVTHVEHSADADMIGNPDAKVLVSEFVSYTCSHCAHFAKEGDGALQLAFIAPGKVRLEVRPVIRNGVDITLTMLAQCGGPDKFIGNHAMLMYRQDEWLNKGRKATAEQRKRWASPDYAAGRRALAADLGLYDMMETRGIGRVAVDDCLKDDARANRLIANSEVDRATFGVTGTPSFAINGQLLEDVHDWASLSQALQAQFPAPAESSPFELDSTQSVDSPG